MFKARSKGIRACCTRFFSHFWLEKRMDIAWSSARPELAGYRSQHATAALLLYRIDKQLSIAGLRSV
jgi:hypothetical protein